ncbi:hypothetical protein A1O1_04635 [Capronia coronata CBS 617.96]|uniref:CsbD-like domain-containing protein n=1 Tax=Capronia coronata CBS 617.96 TaxID=1182541 RepID=W9YDF2_9EURO|nr:uncharacterized protein A1O1_04635 [Capronia coronata CBS 617.96]EXJ87710.1 hypothetical protein A1O1_04635 [Capronia coronata CBS 617.96]
MSSHAPAHDQTTHPTNANTNTHTHTPSNPMHEQSKSNTTPYVSSDPTTHLQAKPTSKLKGDIKGAAHGVAGSLQAATGTVLRNQGMAEKGFEKMNHEDARLAAKTGKPPVGSDTREETVPVNQASSVSGPGAGAGTGTSTSTSTI